MNQWKKLFLSLQQLCGRDVSAILVNIGNYFVFARVINLYSKICFKKLTDSLYKLFNKKGEFCIDSWEWEVLFWVAPFSRKSIVLGSFHVLEDCQPHLFLLTTVAGTSFYQRVSMFPLYSLSFWFRFFVAKSCLFHLQAFLTNTCFSIHTTHSSVNFTWFALHSLMTNLCSSREYSVWLTTILNSLKTNIFARLKWFLQWTNSKQCRDYGKKFGKIFFSFFSKNSLFHWMTLIDR